MSFADHEYANKRKRTRREKFLAGVEQVVPWSALEALIELLNKCQPNLKLAR